MTINMTTFTYPVELSVTEQPIKLSVSNLMYQASGVSSVNAKTGNVVLTAADVGADQIGAANAVADALQPQIDTLTLTTNNQAISIAAKADQDTVDAEFVAVNNAINTGLATANQAVNTKASQTDLNALDARVVSNSTTIGTKADAVETSQALATKATTIQLNEVKALAETNQLNIGTKVDQVDFDSVSDTVTAQGLTLLNKADIATLTTLAQLVNTKADQSYVVSEIARITGNAPAALDTLAEIAEQLGNDQTQINNLLDQIGNRVRFDAAQGLTAPQQTQARDNINAEAKGVAASLVSNVTTTSIGAATAAQGAKANTALQSGDVAPVALSGSFSDLVNKSSLFSLVYSAYALGSNVAISATDTLGQMLSKLQSQVSANDTAINGKEPSITSGNTTQYWRGDKTWQSLATVATTNSYNDLSDKPNLLKGDTGATGNSLMRPTQTITSVSGVVTIDLSNGKEVYLLTLTENVTSWSFINLPSSGLIAEIRIRLVQGASSAYTCASPATSGLTAGGTWVNSSALGAIESLGIAIDGSGNKTLFPSGVYA